jgi:hypothetical protein
LLVIGKRLREPTISRPAAGTFAQRVHLSRERLYVVTLLSRTLV